MPPQHNKLVPKKKTQTRRKLTLVIVRITLTDPKTALAGVILETSFARFMVSMATFNAEMAPSRSFGRWDSASMVGARKRCDVKAVRKAPPFCHDTPSRKQTHLNTASDQLHFVCSAASRSKYPEQMPYSLAQCCVSTSVSLSTWSFWLLRRKPIFRNQFVTYPSQSSNIRRSSLSVCTLIHGSNERQQSIQSPFIHPWLI